MYKALIATLLVGAAAYGGWTYYGDEDPGWLFFTRPERRACARIEDLCDDGEREVNHCRQQLIELREAAGEEAVENVLSCTKKADSCAAATGCLVGGTISGMGRGFFKGLREAFRSPEE